MADTDSFIDEVTEEVRKDRLFGLLRRWGWVPALAVVALVGGTAWTQWQEAQATQAAQAFGDSVLAALEAEDQPARRAALAAIETDGTGQAAILTLLQAGAAAAPDEVGGQGDPQAGTAGLLALADMPDLPARYRHLAVMKVILSGGTGDAAQDGVLLDELAAPGAPFRPLAVEQQALRALAAGDEATAVTLLRLLTEDAEASQALRERAAQVMVALGVELDPA